MKSGGGSIYRREDRFRQLPKKANGKPYGADNQQRWNNGQDQHRPEGGSAHVSSPGIAISGTGSGRQESRTDTNSGSGNVGTQPQPNIVCFGCGKPGHSPLVCLLLFLLKAL